MTLADRTMAPHPLDGLDFPMDDSADLPSDTSVSHPPGVMGHSATNLPKKRDDAKIPKLQCMSQLVMSTTQPPFHILPVIGWDVVHEGHPSEHQIGFF